jgi:chorismate mutase/prephenate dehydratase
MTDIEQLRREIDSLDDELAALIQRRAGLAQTIGELKGGAPAYRPEREAQILKRIADKKGLLSAERLVAVFREIISACRALEQAIRVSYLGPEGTFSEQAVRKHFGRAVEGVPAASIDEAFRRCESGAVQFTVVPVENSTEGAVGRTLDLLLATPLRVCGEVELRVQQNLPRRAARPRRRAPRRSPARRRPSATSSPCSRARSRTTRTTPRASSCWATLSPRPRARTAPRSC